MLPRIASAMLVSVARPRLSGPGMPKGWGRREPTRLARFSDSVRAIESTYFLIGIGDTHSVSALLVGYFYLLYATLAYNLLL